jgi:hemoglobin
MKIGIAVCVALLEACGGAKPAPPAPIAPPAAPAPVIAEPAPPPAPPAPPAPKTLYERLGGLDAITAVTSEFVNRSTSDPRIKERFFNTDANSLKRLLAEFVCAASGGPCTYTGRDMQTSHAGMDLVDEEFDALVEDLVGALDQFKVGEHEKADLLGAIGPLKPQIVGAPGQRTPLEASKLAQASALAATLQDPAARQLLESAVLAGSRGQRSYAEQLFTRAEMLTGPKPVAKVAGVFRAGMPARVVTPPKALADAGAQPKTVGSSEADAPERRPAAGSLHGTVKVDGKPPSGLGVVMLWPQNGGGKRAPKTRVIEQRGKAFAPHVMAVPVGSTVAFPNYDPLFHDVFSISKAKAFDLGMYKSGESREVKLDKPGIVRLGCNLHANMSAYVVVVDAPHYVVVDADGSFAFRSLSPGVYKVQAWDEQSAEPLTTTITIKAGANDSTLELRGGGQPISPDKFGASRAAPIAAR